MMNIRRGICLTLFLAQTAWANLEFEVVDGADIGIGAVLQAHRAEADALGKSTWLWGPALWTDPTGSYAYFSFHGYGTGFLFKRNPDGTYTDVTPAQPEGGPFPPTENRPLIMDADNNGCMDVLHTGDETFNRSASLLSNCDGTWHFSRPHRLGKGGRIVDVNDDGYLDVQSLLGSSGNWGKGYLRTAVNYAGKGFKFTKEAIKLPDDCPDEIVERVNAAEDRYHSPRIYPLTKTTYIVTYGGSYGGEKFTYVVRRGKIVSLGLPTVGYAHRPQDLDGDGDLDVVIQKGDAASGVYLRTGGRYYKDTSGDMPIINDALRVGVYKWDVWSPDLDGDGDNDLVMSTKRSGRGYILDNRGGRFRLVHRVTHVDGEAMALGDADGDGDIDILAASGIDKRNGDAAIFYLNQSGYVPDPAPLAKPDRIPTPAAPSNSETSKPGAALPDSPGDGGDDSPGSDAGTGGDDPSRDNNQGSPQSPVAPFSGPGVPLPDHDATSQAWANWAPSARRASEYALLSVVTGSHEHCDKAITLAQAIVDADTVAGNQYLKSGPEFYDVFTTLDWCKPENANQWASWGSKHLGKTNGSVRKSIWWKHRWSRNNPANNYYHSFVLATSTYAMATGDSKWLNWLRKNRLPRIYAYYEKTPEGGSREGTGYGESHRNIFSIAKMWRDYDGTEVLPQAFIDNSIRYWTHATTPGHRWVALIGDHTRLHGRTDSYHRDIIDNALQLAEDPEAIAIGHWQINRLPPLHRLFRGLVLRDYPDGQPPDALEYHAAGAGHFFARDGWGADATLVYFTAGKHDEAHQQEDQGAFGVWANNEWQTSSDSPWTHGGIAQDVAYQNVIRFPEAENIHNSVSTLTWERRGRTVIVEMDLGPAVGQPWTRRASWKHGSNTLKLRDRLNDRGAVFGFEIPGDDDVRAPSSSRARAEVSRVANGFETVVSWPGE